MAVRASGPNHGPFRDAPGRLEVVKIHIFGVTSRYQALLVEDAAERQVGPTDLRIDFADCRILIGPATAAAEGLTQCLRGWSGSLFILIVRLGSIRLF